MSKGYKLRKNPVKPSQFFIEELDSDTRIITTGKRDQMQEITRKLNLGSGFRGWTPTFFAETVGLAK